MFTYVYLIGQISGHSISFVSNAYTYVFLLSIPGAQTLTLDDGKETNDPFTERLLSFEVKHEGFPRYLKQLCGMDLV